MKERHFLFVTEEPVDDDAFGRTAYLLQCRQLGISPVSQVVVVGGVGVGVGVGVVVGGGGVGVVVVVGGGGGGVLVVL